jgi:uncharacterized membrane protein
MCHGPGLNNRRGSRDIDADRTGILPATILNERYAAGKLTREQYFEQKSDIAAA